MTGRHLKAYLIQASLLVSQQFCMQPSDAQTPQVIWPIYAVSCGSSFDHHCCFLLYLGFFLEIVLHCQGSSMGSMVRKACFTGWLLAGVHMWLAQTWLHWMWLRACPSLHWAGCRHVQLGKAGVNHCVMECPGHSYVQMALLRCQGMCHLQCFTSLKNHALGFLSLPCLGKGSLL